MSVPTSSLPMREINYSWHASPFLEKVVAYETNQDNFGDSKSNFHLQDSKLWYGYINLQSCDYALNPLWKPEADAYNCSLTNPKLKDSPIWMRLADQKEIEDIYQAIINDKAKFNYTSKEKSINMLTHLLEKV